MSYTQSPHLTNNEIEEFIKTAKIARVCSHNKDGTIHAVPGVGWLAYFKDTKGIVTGIMQEDPNAK